MSRKENSKLEKKVLKFKPLNDDDGRRYIPYCDYGWHQGIIKYHQIAETCEKRHCNHYFKFYIR